MGEFQRSPSKVWWGNEYSSPLPNRINFQQQQQQVQWQQNDDQLYQEEDEEETRIYKSSQINCNLFCRNEEAITKFNEPTTLNSNSHESVHQVNGNENIWLNRKSSGSPNSHKSQDSGFSDSETSPIIPNDDTSSSAITTTTTTTISTTTVLCHNEQTFHPKNNSALIAESFFKDANSLNYTPIKNLNINYNEKYSPKQCISSLINAETNKNPQLRKFHSAPTTPEQQTSKNFQQIQPLLIYPNQNHSPKMDTNNYRIALTSSPTPKIYQSFVSKSENSKARNTRTPRSRSTPRSSSSRTSPKVNRNLFSCLPTTNSDEDWLPQKILEDVCCDNNQKLSRTVPFIPTPDIKQKPNLRLCVTAPAGDELKYDPNAISFDYDNNDTCATTFEHIESPVHHSTPKNNTSNPPLPPPPPPPPQSLQRKIFNNILENKRTTNNNNNNNNNTVTAPPVAKWLEELSKLYEAECMVTLQSKSLAADLSRQVAEAATKATVILKSLLNHTKIIYSDFYTILRQLANNNVEHLAPLIQSLNGNVTEFILTYIVNCQANFLTKTEQRARDVQEILQLCDFLRSASTTDCSLEELELNVQKLKSLFRETERGILAIQIQLLVNMIEEPTTELALRGAVQGVTWVSTQQNIVANQFLVRSGAPRALLTVCLESKASTLRAAALRALATICATKDAVRQIEVAGGIEIIADILSEDSRPEPELSEAIAVIAQITAPWIEDNHTIVGLKENAKSLITSLTRFLETSQCCQNLLLCAAALANISSMEPSTVWPLLQCRTAEKLLTAVQKRGPNISVFLKEQVATLLANMSAASESRLQLGEAKAVVALLCFLQVPPYIFNELKNSEQAAGLRLQQKAAVALSRLCNERNISQQVCELGGVNQLVRLCKEKKERSHSDAVLVACLAALRKIVSNCGGHVISEQDAMELVEPRLLDSFLTYSSQNESYV